jgi:hypothetical protein
MVFVRVMLLVCTGETDAATDCMGHLDAVTYVIGQNDGITDCIIL